MVEFPFFADFAIPSKKIILQVNSNLKLNYKLIQVLDPFRLVSGVENVKIYYFKLAETYFINNGWHVHYISQKDFELDSEMFFENIKKYLK